MKTVLFTILFLLMSQSLIAAEECSINYDNYKDQNDCVYCERKMQEPSSGLSALVGPITNFVTKEKEQKEVVRRLAILDHFLNKKENEKRCSNYGEYVKDFQQKFFSYVAKCEKGADQSEKKICDWVLPRYNSKITELLFSYWTDYDKNGKPKAKPGKYPEQIQGPIKAQEAWCTMVESNYKNAIALGCSDLRDLVRGFDIQKAVSESIQRDREQRDSHNPSDITQKRNEFLNQSCKYFDTHNANTYTRGLYLQCVTR